jgi:putative transposase
MYDWRQMTIQERQEVLRERKLHRRPWHRPPHSNIDGVQAYLLSAACYEHSPIVGKDVNRMGQWEDELLGTCEGLSQVHAWCVLPNHYHLLVQTERLGKMREQLGRLHGRSSHRWNGEDQQRGRRVWYGGTDRLIRSDRHFWTSMNYVHNNPVHHGLVDRWQEWPFSSASQFLERVGRETAIEIWRGYPLLDYGNEWD